MDETSFWRHIEHMKQAEVIAVDTETTGLSVKDSRDYLMGISVAYRLGPLGIVSGYFPFRHVVGDNFDKEHLEALRLVLTPANLVFHNLKFDLHSLRTIGISPVGKLYDTLNIQHMLNEELPSKGLDYLSKKYLNDQKIDKVKPFADVFGWDQVPVGLMDEYACHDAELTLRLFELLWPQMKAQELDGLWPIERRFTKTLVDMEQRGVRIDPEFCETMAAKGRDRMLAILDELEIDDDTLGPKALSALLLDVLGLPVHHVSEKTGKPSFNKDAMEFYDELLEERENDPTAKLVLEYRGWQKAVTSLYEPLLRMVSPDGRVRPNFKQHGTRTGRLSCSEPNLQQIPRASDKPWNGHAKRSFVATDGYELWGYDYAQLEFRLATAYGRDTWLVDVFNDETRDVFTELASRIGEERQDTKTYVYCTMYGGGKGKVAQTLGKPLASIEGNYEAFRDSIAGIRAVSDVATKKARANGFVRYWSGRRRHFPYDDGYHKAFNSILQGGAAELVKRAMIDIDENVCDNNCRMVLQVHDEIVFEIREGLREVYEPEIIKRMTNFPQFGVNLKVEGKLWNA